MTLIETMLLFDYLDSFLFFASRVFCGPLGILVLIQRCGLFLLIISTFTYAAYIRNREVKRIKRNIKHGNSFAFLYRDIQELEHSKQANLPRVTVIMPLKGFGEHNLQNWKTQIMSLYGGPLEFLFVVDSTEDPAYHGVSQLLAEFKDQVDIKIIVAGPCTNCSQKIHNQLVGVEKMHKDSKYVLFLDDDVRLHPGSIGALTYEMEKNPEIFIQSGYPLELPSGSLASYCIFGYHLPMSVGFATGGRTIFAWGGCMMMHAHDFRTDLHGVVSGLRDGGYSDDMTLAAIAGEYKRLIWSPPVAVFPHPLATDITFSRYWNFLRKQTFALETYKTDINRKMNRGLITFHCCLSFGFVAPYIMAVIHVVAATRWHFKERMLQETVLNSGGGLFMAGFLSICTVIELLLMWNLTRVEVNLCNLLSPETPPLLLASYNWFLVFVALFVNNFLFSISVMCSRFSQSINWSGIQYHLKDGKIIKIDRSKEKGLKSSDLGNKLVYGKKRSSTKVSVVASLSKTLARWWQPKKYDM